MNREQKYTLVILAAGIGSRFGQGIKQLNCVGPSGQIMMDYSVHDAIRAGFRRIVFIIRRDIEADFRAVIGQRMEAVCKPRNVEIAYAYQSLEDLPEGFACPPDRQKPWGTGHALLACRGLLDGPFAVLNADDYYGQKVFTQIRDFLAALPADSSGRYCLAGYRLCNTLSDHGGVTRGICQVDGQGFLRRVAETRNIVKTAAGAAVETEGGLMPVDPASCVSMNLWGLTPDILARLENRFRGFLEAHRLEPKAEFLLPMEIDGLLAESRIQVQVLPTEARWFGITYQEDAPAVRAAFRELTEQGVYGKDLYADLEPGVIE